MSSLFSLNLSSAILSSHSITLLPFYHSPPILSLSSHSITLATLWLNLYARAMASLTTILPNSRVFPPKNIITCRIFLIHCFWIDYGLLRSSFNENTRKHKSSSLLSAPISWPELTEAQLALTSINYHRNI